MSDGVSGQQAQDWPVPPGPRPRGRVAATLGTMTPRDWAVAVLTGVGGYVFAFVIGVISIVLTIAIVAADRAAGSGLGSIPDSSGSASSLGFSDALSAVGNLFAGPAQLIALADLGRLGAHGSSAGLLAFAGSAQLGVVPMLVAAAQIVALVVITRLAARRDEPFGVRLVGAVVSGLVLAVVSLIAGLAFAFRVPETSGISISAISATGPASVVVALLVGMGATLFARPLWLSRLHPILNAGLGILRVAAMHIGLLSALVAVGLIVWAAIAQNGSAAVLPLLLGNLAIVVTAIGMFGGVSASQSTGQLMSSMDGGAGSTTGTLSVFSSPSGWIWLLVLFAVLFAVAGGFALAVRRNASMRPHLDWALTIGAYLVVGIAVLVLGTAVYGFSVTGSGSAAETGSAGSIGITPWTPLVFALWGAAVEAVARWVAPRSLARAPRGVFRVLPWFIGSDSAAYRGWTPPLRRPAYSAPQGVAPDVRQEVAPDVRQDGSVQYGRPQYGAANDGVAYGAGALPHEPMSPRVRKILVRSVIGGGALVVVIIAAAITASVLRNSVWGPAPVADRFVQAVADGDTAKVRALSEVSGIGSGMLTDKVVHGATKRISDVSVGTVRRTGDVAVATVTYRQGSDRHSASVTLQRTGTSWLVKDDWRVTSSLVGEVYVAVPTALSGSEVTANGVVVGTAQDGSLTLKAFPGDYRISIAGTKYFSGKTETISVVDGDAASVRVAAKPTATLQTDAKKIVTDRITSCAAETTGDLPDDCPFYGAYGQTSGVTYTVTKMPDLDVAVAGDGTIEVTSSSSGEVETKYTDTLFGDAYPYDETDSFRVYEYLKVKDGKLVTAQ